MVGVYNSRKFSSKQVKTINMGANYSKSVIKQTLLVFKMLNFNRMKVHISLYAFGTVVIINHSWPFNIKSNLPFFKMSP